MVPCKARICYYVSVIISKKFTICKLALMVILSPQSSNAFMTLFVTLSVSAPVQYC